MTKQAEIREGINQYLTKRFICDQDGEVPEDECLHEADALLAYLHSHGVVIRADRELPAMESQERSIIFADFLKKSGYVAVEPLNETTRRSK